ncbi:MAG: HIT family protein [Actinomycetota bacterium]|nr:HIT family protein [Actinomycetota bacterium]
MCLFCEVVERKVRAEVVYEDETSMAFLDHRPLFMGHTLLVPKEHHETLADLPPALVKPFFATAQLLARCVQTAFEAQGTFVAMNNIVSQSVPHLHLHVVPRRRKDGLRGFFWPRTKYASPEEMAETGERLRTALAKWEEAG